MNVHVDLTLVAREDKNDPSKGGSSEDRIKLLRAAVEKIGFAILDLKTTAMGLSADAHQKAYPILVYAADEVAAGRKLGELMESAHKLGISTTFNGTELRLSAEAPSRESMADLRRAYGLPPKEADGDELGLSADVPSPVHPPTNGTAAASPVSRERMNELRQMAGLPVK